MGGYNLEGSRIAIPPNARKKKQASFGEFLTSNGIHGLKRNINDIRVTEPNPKKGLA